MIFGAKIITMNILLAILSALGCVAIAFLAVATILMPVFVILIHGKIAKAAKHLAAIEILMRNRR